MGHCLRAAFACPLAAAVFLAGCQAAAPLPPPGSASLGALDTDQPQKIIEKIPGTALTLELVRIPARPAPEDGSTSGIDSFYMSTTEITWDLYDIFVYRLDEQDVDEPDGDGPDAVTRPSKPYVPPDRGFGHEGYPAISMTRHAAEQFCRWLSEKTGRTYRLPTDAEWAHACRAGRSEEALGTIDVGAHAWHDGNADWQTHPVGRKKPNPLGLFDMLGNASEWVIPEDREKLIALGGNYLDPPEEISCDARIEQDSSWNASDPQIPKSEWWLADCSWVGFRVVCEANEVGEPQMNTDEH